MLQKKDNKKQLTMDLKCLKSLDLDCRQQVTKMKKPL